jgi:hypothetical protein
MAALVLFFMGQTPIRIRCEKAGSQITVVCWEALEKG